MVESIIAALVAMIPLILIFVKNQYSDKSVKKRSEKAIKTDAKKFTESLATNSLADARDALNELLR